MTLFDRFRSTPAVDSLYETAQSDPEAAREHLDDLLAYARSEDPQERTHAYRALAAVGEAQPEAVVEHDHVLAAGLTDEMPAVRAAAAAAIAALPHRTAVDGETYHDLVQMVEQGTVDEAVAAARALGEAAAAFLVDDDLSNSEAKEFRKLLWGCAETLQRALATTDRRQDAAAETLLVLSSNCPAVVADLGPRVGEALADHLRHPGRKGFAVATLANIAGEEPTVVAPVVDEVAHLTRDEEETVRHLATGALARLSREDPAAVTPHVDALADRLEEGDEDVAFVAAVGLTRVADDHPGCVVAAVEGVTSVHVESDDVGVLMHGLLESAGMVDAEPEDLDPTYVPGETFGLLAPDGG